VGFPLGLGAAGLCLFFFGGWLGAKAGPAARRPAPQGAALTGRAGLLGYLELLLKAAGVVLIPAALALARS
jgi:hypothetical protein